MAQCAYANCCLECSLSDSGLPDQLFTGPVAQYYFLWLSKDGRKGLVINLIAWSFTTFRSIW